MRITRGLAVFAALLSTAFSACGDKSPNAESVKKETGEAWDAVKKWGAEKRDVLIAKTSEGMKSLEKPMADAKAKAGDAGSEASKSLDAAWKTAQEKLEALKNASGPAFAKARDEMVAAYDALKAKLHK